MSATIRKVHPRVCRVCRCTDDDGCPEGCFWVGYDLCSACHAKQKPAPLKPGAYRHRTGAGK